jgi:acyl-coenzyme A synthetase/AMP-(fatty) acid ligase
MEIESALVDRSAVAEAAVNGRPHEIKGRAIATFVTIKHGRRTPSRMSRGVDPLRPRLADGARARIAGVA